ncbi:unnamed protein product [Aureobasidium mustum]|uniref:Uncharacterized protein n=1 Tax=Aureobasidium mustum TaxID=2773714 RepID=A0A9N8JYT8_9PEZI|nr:unnamed protein product [Aureobasidium mustum]
MPRTKQTPRPKVEFEHDELTTPFTKARQTSIRIPDLRRDHLFNALFILDEVPATVLEKNRKLTGGYFLWLAENNLEALPQHDADGSAKPRISTDRVSSFIGKTVEDAFRFIATVPLENLVDRQFIAVLDHRLYKEKDWLVIYRIDAEGEITSIPCKAEFICMQLHGYQNHNWPTFMDDWLRKGKPVFHPDQAGAEEALSSSPLLTKLFLKPGND